MGQEYLGHEQASDALNCAGTAASSQGRPELAALCFDAALVIDPTGQSVAWNAGWIAPALTASDVNRYAVPMSTPRDAPRATSG